MGNSRVQRVTPHTTPQVKRGKGNGRTPQTSQTSHSTFDPGGGHLIKYPSKRFPSKGKI